MTRTALQRPLGCRVGSLPAAAHFAKVSSSQSKETAPGMGLFFHVWACLIRSQGSPAQAGKCLLVSANTDDRNVCPGHCSALNGAEKTLQSVVSTNIPSLGMPEERLAPWEGGTTFLRGTKVQESGPAGPAVQPEQKSNTRVNSRPQRSPRLFSQDGQCLPEHLSSR